MGLTGEGMQPFSLHGNAVVCNGELYGFRPVKKALEDKGYVFHSGSDCEILLPLYEEYGTDMFAMLDAEFALILYDGSTGSFLARRDPIGIRPLYYGYDRDGAIVFASEPKNLVGLCQEIMPFPPGHYYKGRGIYLLPRHHRSGKGLRGRSGNRLPEHPGKALRRHRKAAGFRRPPGLSLKRRAGFFPGGAQSPPDFLGSPSAPLPSA